MNGDSCDFTPRITEDQVAAHRAQADALIARAHADDPPPPSWPSRVRDARAVLRHATTQLSAQLVTALRRKDHT